MAQFTITASGSVALGDGDTVKIDIPTGGNVVVTAGPFGGVGQIKIDFQNFDTISNQATVDLGTFSQNGLQIDIKNYDPTDQVSLKGASITGLVPGSTDELAFSYVGADGATYTGVAHIKDDGQQNFNAAQKPLTICFTTGARIRGIGGDIRVEDLVVGDLVETLHHGLQRLRWIGAKRLSNVELGLHPHLRPILINAGALGQGLPSRDLLVSPQHRMMVESAASQVLFGQDRVLMAAKHLVNGQSILVARDQVEVTYYHLLFDRHEIVFANDAPSESLHPGGEALDALDIAARGEVLALFPELKQLKTSRQTALPVLRRFEARVLCDFGAEV